MTDEDGRRSIGSILDGLEMHPLPEGWTAQAAVVLVKCLDEDGDPTWAFRTTTKLNDEELLGALVIRTDILREELLASYTEGDDQLSARREARGAG